MPTNVLVPAGMTGRGVFGTVPSAGSAGDAAGAGVGEADDVEEDSGFSGPRRLNTGRSESPCDEEDWSSTGAGVALGAGAGALLVAPASPLWRIGLSSVDVTGAGVSAFLVAVMGCHLPSAVQPLLFTLFTMVT